MPRIPLYESQTQLATGPLSRQADAGAFTAPGRALSQFGETASQIAFQFGQAEKNAETKSAFTKLKTQYIDEVNDFQRNDKSTTTAQYQRNFNEFNRKFEKNYNALNLTGNQLRDVKNQMSLLVSNAQQTGKQVAFARGRDEASKLNDSIIKNYVAEISKLPIGNPLRDVMIQEANKEIENAALNGETKFLDIKTKTDLTSQIKRNDINLLADTTDSLDDLDKLKTQTLDDVDMLAEEKTAILTKIGQKEASVLTQAVSRVNEVIFTATNDDFRVKTKDDAIKQIKEGKEVDIYTVVDGKRTKINFGKIPAKYREQFVNNIEVEFNKRQDKKFNDTYTAVQADIMSKSLSELEQLQKDVRLGKAFPQFKDKGKRNQLIALVQDEIRNKAPRVVSESKTIIETINTRISVNGETTDEDDALYNKAHNGLILAKEYQQAANLKKEFNALKLGANAFKQIEFEGLVKTDSARQVLSQNLQNNPTPENKKALEIFDKLAASRKDFLEKNPVGYYLAKKGKKIQDVTVDELINFQKNMDVLPLNIRVTTNAELEAFKSSYDGAQTYTEKANALNNFVRSKGIENENRIMRHLVSSGTISLRDNFQAAFSTNSRSKNVFIGNAPDNVKRYNSEVSKTNRDAASNEISILFSDYSNSYLGGSGADDVLGGGFTKGRASFILGMRDLVKNTANFYMLTQDITPEAAAQKAFDDAIGSNYNLSNKINDGVVRFDKSISDGDATAFTNMLEVSLVRNVDYLKQVVQPPPPPQGLDEAGIAQYNENYYQELAENGSWRTSNDNKGVYLVDAVGQIVPRKDVFVGPGDTQQPFVSVQFSRIGESLEKYKNIVKDNPNIYQQGTKLLEYFNQEGHLF